MHRHGYLTVSSPVRAHAHTQMHQRLHTPTAPEHTHIHAQTHTSTHKHTHAPTWTSDFFLCSTCTYSHTDAPLTQHTQYLYKHPHTHTTHRHTHTAMRLNRVIAGTPLRKQQPNYHHILHQGHLMTVHSHSSLHFTCTNQILPSYKVIRL